MEPLARQLQGLSEQAKKTEDVVAAARERNRARLEAHRDQLHDAWTAAVNRTRQQVDADDAALQFRWWQMRERIRGHFAELQDRSERWRGDHDVKKAERRANQAERDAAEAVDFAVIALNGAMEAVVDAVLARADADELATSSR
jgi:exonuclease VII large subunit